MIDVSPTQLETILEILARYAPGCQARAFGSRYHWTAKDYSDLDLVILGERKRTLKEMAALREAFEESELPFRVDVLDWRAISPEFQRLIEQGYEVIQDPAGFKRSSDVEPGLGMRSNEWKETLLGEIAEIIMGQSPTGKTCNQVGNGLPLLNGPTEFGNYHPSPVQFTTDPKKTSNYGDLLFCVRGSTTGRMNWSDRVYAIGRGIAAIRHKKGGEYQPFLKALIDYYLPFLLTEATGSTFPNVSSQQLNNLLIRIPQLHTQRRIAEILSALDDKIELNRQTNATLEAIAQTIFKEWFVNFNFPGATGEIIESELGLIPKEWRVGRLGDIYETRSGGTPRRDQNEYYENGYHQWVKSKELNGSFITDTEEKISDDAIKNSSAKLLPKHSVLVAMYGATVGQVGLISSEATTNQAICAFIPNKNFPFTFIYLFLKINQDEIISRAVGSAQQNISQEMLKNFELNIPDTRLIDSFHTLMTPIFFFIEDNLKQSSTLAAIRDALLPKLMNGEIEV